MIEFDEKLNKKFTSSAALQKRVLYRTQWESGIIPFSLYGVDYKLFTLDKTSFELSLRGMLADITSAIQVQGDHVVTADITLDINTLGVNL